MCTLVLNHAPGAAFPLLVAANRDEMMARIADPPAPHWPDRPQVIAGRDRSGGGTWMGVNRAGVMAAILNRPGSLGPAAGKRSRGELPLLALEHPTAQAAAQAIAALDGRAWRSFNLVIADATAAFFLRGTGLAAAEIVPLPPGLSMITAHDPNDLASPRVARHLPRFRAAALPAPPDWGVWPALLADGTGSAAEQIDVAPRAGFATVSASLLGRGRDGAWQWLYAAGPPHAAEFAPVAMDFGAA